MHVCHARTHNSSAVRWVAATLHARSADGCKAISARAWPGLRLLTRDGGTGVAGAPVRAALQAHWSYCRLRGAWYYRRGGSGTARARIRTRLRTGRATGQGSWAGAAARHAGGKLRGVVPWGRGAGHGKGKT